MTVSQRRVWHAAPITLTIVWIFTVVAGIGIPLLGYLAYTLGKSVWLAAFLGVLTVVCLVYAWRFGLHPQLRVTDDQVTIKNPFRTHTFAWEDITLLAPGENGLLVGSEERQAEAWCIQKSNSATRRGRRTRSDRITSDLLDLLDGHNPPVVDAERGLRIRRARPDESRLLTRLERAASEAELVHVFPPDHYPYPTAEVAKRWRGLLRDRLARVHILELVDAPIGFVAFKEDTVLHLGIVPEHTRRGYGSALLDYATAEMFGGGIPAARLWVLAENGGARRFYRSLGWVETELRRDCEFPPYPEEIQLVRTNPSAPRRSRPTA